MMNCRPMAGPGRWVSLRQDSTSSLTDACDLQLLSVWTTHSDEGERPSMSHFVPQEERIPLLYTLPPLTLPKVPLRQSKVMPPIEVKSSPKKAFNKSGEKFFLLSIDVMSTHQERKVYEYETNHSNQQSGGAMQK